MYSLYSTYTLIINDISIFYFVNDIFIYFFELKSILVFHFEITEVS